MNAVIEHARVTLTQANGSQLATETDASGHFHFSNLSSGKYVLRVESTGFVPFAQNLQVESGTTQNIPVHLEIAVQHEEIQVQAAPTIAIAPGQNASATILRGSDLDALSDDPDELLSDLQALAGPSVGPNGGEVYVDGFSNATLPPKNSIREIRINQNPFSAEYDRLGYGRVEVFTKPGTDQVHAQLMFLANSDVLNTVNPFLHASVASQPTPQYLARQYIGSIIGSLKPKASCSFNFERRNMEDEALVNAQDSPTGRITQLAPVVRLRTNLSPRLDYQLTPNDSLTARYQYLRDNESNDGIGALVEASNGYNLENEQHLLQLSDTQILGPRALNETRFQLIRALLIQSAVDTSAETVVPGAYVRGGNPIQRSADLSDRFELQNYTSISRGQHLIRFGGRLRSDRESNSLVSNAAGTFTFDSLAAATPSEYMVARGPALANLTYFDEGLFVQDDQQVRPYLTVSYGLRVESQTSIHNKADWVPRIGIAWGVGRRKDHPAFVLRAGWGMFYERFPQSLVLQARRFSATGQQQYIISDPVCLSAYPAPPPIACAGSPAVYQISPRLTAPYVSQAAISLEHALGKNGKLAITYLNSRGVHELYLNNINAPQNASEPTASRPYPSRGDIYEYESGGIFKQTQIVANVNFRAGARWSFNGYYSLGYANGDVSGTTASPGFASNPYDLLADYGRAPFDIRHRGFASATISLPWLLRLSPFVTVHSGTPSNITTAQDLNGDSIRNDRPGLVATSTPYPSPCGSRLFLDPNPKPAEKIIPINCASGPTLASANLKISKAFTVGRHRERTENKSSSFADRGGTATGIGTSAPHGPGASGLAMGNGRYTLAAGATIRNIFNIVNPATPIGVVGSPLFGQSVALAGGPFSSTASAANRQIELGLRFEF